MPSDSNVSHGNFGSAETRLVRKQQVSQTWKRNQREREGTKKDFYFERLKEEQQGPGSMGSPWQRKKQTQHVVCMLFHTALLCCSLKKREKKADKFLLNSKIQIGFSNDLYSELRFSLKPTVSSSQGWMEFKWKLDLGFSSGCSNSSNGLSQFTELLKKKWIGCELTQDWTSERFH